MITRRALGLAAASCATTAALDSQGLGRVPIGGRMTLRVPWPTARIDPHELHDSIAALFGSAIADSAYARDGRGRVHPTLADGMPTVEEGQTIVKLRAGLRTAKGLSITGRDLAWSISRARRRGVIGLFAKIDPFIRSDSKRPLIARFGKIDPGTLALMLTSPLTAVLPVGFDPTAPDGTGPFKASCSSSRLVLTRNNNASRGASFLETVVAHRANELSDSLRSFESGQDDVGWLGMGFHGTRQNARRFDYRDVGWVILATGNNTAPGVAQRLANHVPVERLGVGLKSWPAYGGSTAWTGLSATLLYDATSGHMKAIAEGVAAKLGQLTATGVSPTRLRSARRSGAFALAVDVVRRIDGGGPSSAIALATADKPDLGLAWGRKPTKTVGAPHTITPQLRIGVLAPLAVHGGVAAGILLAPMPNGRGISWGGSYRAG